MLKYRLILLFWIGFGIAFGQDLTLRAEIVSPTYCRTSSLQSGNGELTAVAEGGVPPYTYFWEQLSFGPLQSTNTTVIAQSPGIYVVTAIDSIGDQVSDTLVVDSINPTPDFEIISNDLTFDNGIYVGFEKAKIHLVNINNKPIFEVWPYDTNYFWNLDLGQTGIWTPKRFFEEIDTNYTKGKYDICLVETNYNGCTDTLCKTIQILEFKNNIGSIYTNQGLDEITVTNPSNKEDVKIMIYNVSGQLVLEHLLEGPIEFLQFNVAKGVYIFQFINTSNGDYLSAGKFLN